MNAFENNRSKSLDVFVGNRVATIRPDADISSDVAKRKRKSAPESGVAGVQIDADANGLVQAWCESHGTIKRTVLSKITRWWCKQNEAMQFALLRAGAENFDTVGDRRDYAAAMAMALDSLADDMRRLAGISDEMVETPVPDDLPEPSQTASAPSAPPPERHRSNGGTPKERARRKPED